MAGRYVKRKAEGIFQEYSEILGTLLIETNKSFEAMDLDNSDVWVQMGEETGRMIRLCNELRNEMEGYDFL